MIAWVRDPLYPTFYSLRMVGFTWKIESVRFVKDSNSISTCPTYKIRSYIYLLTTSVMVHLARVFRLSGLTHGGPPCSFLSSPRYMVPLVPDIVNDGVGSREIFGGKFWQPDSVSESLRGLGFAKAMQRFIYRGTTIATGISDVIRAVATENHSSDGRLPSSTCC
jgi:hypothetical protein